MLVQKMQIIVDKYVQHYKNDFEYDKKILEAPEEQFYIWIVRNTGTYLINKSKLKETPYFEYYLELQQESNNKNSYGINFFEINTSSAKIRKIRNPKKYYDKIA